MKPKLNFSEAVFFSIIILMIPLAFIQPWQLLQTDQKPPEVSAHDLPLWQWLLCPEEYSNFDEDSGYDLVSVYQIFCIYKHKNNNSYIYFPWSRVFIRNIYWHLVSQDPSCSSWFWIQDGQQYFQYGCG